MDEADAGVISARRTHASDPDFRALVQQLDSDLNGRYGALQKTYDAHNASHLIPNVVVLSENQRPIACGAFKPFDASSIEIKRMFVAPEARKRGMASRILAELEAWARELGYTHAVLETGSRQMEAFGLYTKLGYQPIENYGPYVGNPNSRCFRKALFGDQR